jgi:hypothetical protein
MEQRIFHRLAGMLVLAGALVAQDTPSPGTYKGQWTGGSAGGDIQMTFLASGNPEVSFTLGGENVKAKVLSFKVDGSKFKLVYEFDAQGTMLQSATEATVKGKTIEGTYKTTAGDQAIDAGTWKATAP